LKTDANSIGFRVWLSNNLNCSCAVASALKKQHTTNAIMFFTSLRFSVNEKRENYSCQIANGMGNEAISHIMVSEKQIA
jgi:hypothetical protein